jgi:hypothetical protein
VIASHIRGDGQVAQGVSFSFLILQTSGQKKGFIGVGHGPFLGAGAAVKSQLIQHPESIHTLDGLQPIFGRFREQHPAERAGQREVHRSPENCSMDAHIGNPCSGDARGSNQKQN